MYTFVLQEIMGIKTNNSCLIRLGNISKNHIHHSHQHTILNRSVDEKMMMMVMKISIMMIEMMMMMIVIISMLIIHR